ncbi:MAG: hypothetical protein K2K88_09855 [Muribaculaceae bacterium]|nr:hypothetical protein [Muribaculaceae bacterium]MDE6642539.1 hypothetical protein [Muribaculaceae bacterium]
MKKLIAMTLMLLPMLARGQKIIKSEIDKFTGQRIVETSQEAIAKRNKWKNQWQQVLVSVRYTDGEWTMPVFFELEEIEKYDENSQVILLLANGERIILPSLYTGIGAEDCPIGLGGVNSHVHGFSTILPLENKDVELLRQYEITDVRVSPLGKNYDFVIGKKEGSTIMTMINLIDNAVTK